MGQIILLDNIYPYEIPSPPSDETKILFYDRKKEDQIWQRPEIPNFRKLSIKERNAYIDQERERVMEGVWMFINGELVWITNMHYDFLMYANLPEFGGPAAYYDSQREDFYFWDFVDNDPNCFGEMTIKPRRYGYTGMNTTRGIHYAIRDFNQSVGMISTDMKKVKDTLFRPIVDSLTSRPKFLRPQMYAPNNKVPQTEIRFRNVKLKDEDEEDSYLMTDDSGMRSWISPRSTTAKAFDGHKWNLTIFDEVWKWSAQCSPYNTWYITKETLQVGGKIYGKAALFASMGDDDNCEEAVADGIKLWGESDYNNRNAFGRTVSGLYRKFIPADAAYGMFIDKFGKCNRSLAREFLLEERSHLEEGTKEYLYHVRKYPLTVEEALGTAANQGVFNSLRLSTKLAKIQVAPTDQKGYRKGMFEWDPIGERVVFKPSAIGYWKIVNITDKPDALNRWKHDPRGGMRRPPHNPEGVIGNDPIKTSDNVSGHLSNFGAYAFQKYDYFGNGGAGKLRGQLFGRDEDVDLFNEQLRLGCLFWGYPCMTERQVTSTYDWFRGKGMKEWLLPSPFDDAIGIFSTPKTINDGIEKIQAIIKRPKKDEIDWLETVVFEELLQQLKDFQVGKSKLYDAVMGFIMTLHGLDKIYYTFDTPESLERRKRMLSALFPKRA